MIEVQGNGNIVAREVNISSFIRLHIGCKGIIELHQSDEEKIIFETDENLQEYFVATNAGSTLFVSNEARLRRLVFTKSIIKIYLRQIDTLYVRNDHGNVICPNVLKLSVPLKIVIQSHGNTELNIETPAIKILSQSHGDVNLKGRCEKLEIKNMSHGNFDASDLVAGDLRIKNMTKGNVDLQAERTIQISHFGCGYIHYSGNAVLKNVKQCGSGEVKHVRAAMQ